MNDRDNGQEIHDIVNIGKGVKRLMRKHNMKHRVIKKNLKEKKNSKRQETINHKNSKNRIRMEHIFGLCKQSMREMFSPFIGLYRNAAVNTLTNFIYNMNRYEEVVRPGMNC